MSLKFNRRTESVSNDMSLVLSKFLLTPILFKVVFLSSAHPTVDLVTFHGGKRDPGPGQECHCVLMLRPESSIHIVISTAVCS